jgi:tRNA-2-methylthio-N6-dimethylallyladenosine synthase
LGQIVNHYRAPDRPGSDFADLLEAVAEVPGVERVRFASPHPRHVTRRLVAAMRDLPKVCRHVHLPVQSGSNRILARMRRRHSREQYVELVAELRAAIPALALSTDMIVGFPGETTQDFDDTVSLVREIQYSSMFSFKYSPRPNTLAGRRLLDDVPEPEKTRRIMELQATQKGIQLAIHQAAVGSTVRVLADSVSRRRGHELAGRTTGNTVVNFPGPQNWIGRFVDVRVERAGPNSLAGTPVAVEGIELGELPGLGPSPTERVRPARPVA